jgi:zinc D-Ala-D-Ala dipeptidase
VTDDEPLVVVDDGFDCANRYAGLWPGVPVRTWLRSGVAERLHRAQQALPDGWTLRVWDGWRSPVTIRALHEHFYGPGSTLPPGFVADPNGAGVPPHLTGGAVDVTATVDGDELWFGTEFDEFVPHAAALWFERADAAHGPGGAAVDSTTVRDRRRTLRAAMASAGFVGLAEEWWHFSYGDEAWAVATGAAALYGATTPPDTGVG